MSDRALSFGASAEAYERFRPGYPAELFDLVTSYAGTPIRTALEIGAGTGKATRLFASRGIPVTATDPDPAMLTELRKHVPPSVTTRQLAFEDIRPRDKYGLVFAAAALHWTDPENRWTRLAGLLEPNGIFTAFGAPLHPADPALENAIRGARAPFLQSDDIPAPPPDLRPLPGRTPPSPDDNPPTPGDRDGAAPVTSWPGTELQRSAWFTDVRECVIPRRLTLAASDYIGHLSTISAYLELPDSRRREVFRRIAAVLPGTVEVSGDIIVHLARRRSDR